MKASLWNGVLNLSLGAPYGQAANINGLRVVDRNIAVGRVPLFAVCVFPMVEKFA